MLAIICQHVYLQVVRVRGVCARLLIVFAFASLSVYASLAALGMLHIRAVTHRSVTYGAFSWRNQFVLSQSQGQLQQAVGCTRVAGSSGGGGACLQGLISMFPERPVQTEGLDPSVREG